MKKLYLFLALIAGLTLQAQVKLPENIKHAQKSTPVNFENKEQWLEWTYNYSIKYNQTPVGVKHLFEELDRLLKLNGKSFEQPTLNKTFLASYSEDLKAYDKLNTALKVGDSEIDMTWSTGAESYIAITLNSEVYEIVVTKQ